MMGPRINEVEREFRDLMPSPPPMRRRDFLKVSSGIVVFFTLGDATVFAQEGRPRSRDREVPQDFNAFLRIAEDGRVTCFTGKIEMGQGIVTSLAQMLADELDVSLESVSMTMGDTDLCPWDMGTWGSMSTRFFGPALRAAGAEARQVLLALAAEELKVPVEQLEVENGVVFPRKGPGQRVSFADLARGKAIERHLDGPVTVKDPSEFKIVGKPVTRRDAVEKVTGKAHYAGDIRLPGMLYARILRPPAHDAKLLAVDTSAVSEVAGARVIEDGDIVAVLHELPDEAERALSNVRAEFDVPAAAVNDTTIFEHLLRVAPDGDVVAEGGDVRAGEQQATRLCEQTYYDGYVAHAAMETHAALAQFENGKVTVWAATQTPFGARDAVASALGLSPEKVRIITPYVGGGFGGKTDSQHVIEAARLARAAGKPVQVMWSREEEFFYDTFRPAAVVKIRSGVSDEGRIVSWDYHVYFAGDRGAAQFYDIPNHSTKSYGSGWRPVPGSHPFATGAWRAPANNTNTFARESHMDTMAADAGVDPLTFRLNHLRAEKMRRVLTAAAEKFGWSSAAAPSGRGCGIACGNDAGTDVAAMVEVEADKRSGKVQVKRVVCAQDMGLVINPAGATIQMEGCITMGLGYALAEDIHFKGGDILDRNFDTYEIPRFSWLPRIETVIIDNKSEPPQGGGEPAIILMGAAIANAIYDAIGARVRQLPMTPQRVREAVEG